LGKATMLKQDGEKVMRSVRSSLPLPSVIRLLNADYSKPISHKFSRRAMFKRDNYTCQYCGTKNRDDLTVDHVNPQSRGGEDSWTNCVTACLKCNNKKGNRTPEEMGWLRPKAKPYMAFDFNDLFGVDESSV
jgi:5-methylcytosine-specific restriction endonuclease McrA